MADLLEHLFGEDWKLGVFRGPDGLILHMPVENGFIGWSFDFPISEAEFAVLRKDKQRYDLLSKLLHDRLQQRMVERTHNDVDDEILPLIRGILRGSPQADPVQSNTETRQFSRDQLEQGLQDWQVALAKDKARSLDATSWRPEVGELHVRPVHRAKGRSRFEHLNFIRSWLFRNPLRKPARQVEARQRTRMSSHERDEYLRGVSMRCLAKASEAGLKPLIEAQTGLSFASWLSDRKAAHALKMATRDWIATQCLDCFKGFPFAEAEMTPAKALMNATTDVFWEMVCQHFGEDRAIALRNLAHQDPTIREAFLAEGDNASDRDFSFLLGRLAPQD